MGILLMALKMVGILLLAAVLLLAVGLWLLARRPFVPKRYTERVKAGGPLEARYLTMGSHRVATVTAEAPGDWKRFFACYPAGLPEGRERYPAVVMVNGTGVRASKYPALFRHLASWGFVVLGNEDSSTCTGDSADATLAWLLGENDNPASIFYGRIDTGRIGISGHSQGGVGVFNAVGRQPHRAYYRCAVSLSPTERTLAVALGMDYDPAQARIPTLILAADGKEVIPPAGVSALLDAIPADRAAALRRNTDHGRMLYEADGYVTAWFCWQLRDDPVAARAFLGADAELPHNPLYRDSRCHFAEGGGSPLSAEIPLPDRTPEDRTT